jgi:hypothetical protein
MIPETALYGSVRIRDIVDPSPYAYSINLVPNAGQRRKSRIFIQSDDRTEKFLVYADRVLECWDMLNWRVEIETIV